MAKRSDEHDLQSLKGITWLGVRCTPKGIRAATEVSLANGYVTDAFALCSFQGRFFEAYCRSWSADQHVLVNYFACVLESKASRNDLLSTFNNSEKHANRKEPIGHLHWVIANSKDVSESDLPDFWGILVKSGPGLKQVKPPIYCPQETDHIDRLAHRLLWKDTNSAWKKLTKTLIANWERLHPRRLDATA